MTYYKTSQEWFHYSLLLIEAYPTTTRITTKYSIKRPRPRPSKDDSSAPDASTTTAAPMEGVQKTKPPRANLILKTYDPVSGAVLKYKTTKAAEVNRLVQVLGKLGRGMAGLAGAREAFEEAEGAKDSKAEEKAVAAEEGEAGEPAAAAQKGGKGQGQASGGGGGGGGKKKKKGRK